MEKNCRPEHWVQDHRLWQVQSLNHVIAAYLLQDNVLFKQSDTLYETKTKLRKICSDDTLKWKTQNRNTQSTEDRKHELRYQWEERASESIGWESNADHPVEFFHVWSSWRHHSLAACYWTLSMPACTSVHSALQTAAQATVGNFTAETCLVMGKVNPTVLLVKLVVILWDGVIC